MGFGTEIFFFLALGGLVLGPKRLHAMLGHVAQARARFQETTQALKSQLALELNDKKPEGPSMRSSGSSLDN